MSVARRTRRWYRRALTCGMLLAAAALALPAQQAAAAPVDPPFPAPRSPADQNPADQPLPQLLQMIQSLYQQAEQATESFDKAAEETAAQRAKADQLDKQLADQLVAVSRTRDDIGRLASRQYRTGGVSPYLNLLAADDPQEFFSQKHLLERAADSQADLLERLQNGEIRLTALNSQAQHALDRAQTTETQQAAAKKDVEDHLKRVESIVAGLTGIQLDELQALEEQGVDRAQRDLLDSKTLGAEGRSPSQAGNRAVGYAFLQLGKPYVWGAEGPQSFDCSGLTSQAWQHAGVTVPRTSQEQWAQLPKVPLNQLRPGDLVVYFPGATHVAMYIGDGLVVQAPRPGASVKVSPIAANPILGAVRPDTGQESIRDYAAPEIPDGAQGTTPIGDEGGNSRG